MSSIEHGRPLIGPSSQNSSMNIAKKSAKCKIPSRRKKKELLACSVETEPTLQQLHSPKESP
jgi:hypothetical protein